MKIKKKTFYFCIRGISHQIQFYTGWVLNARKRNLPIYLFTTTSFKEYFSLNPKLRKKKEFIFIPCFRIFDRFVVTIFFLYQIIRNRYTIIQVRKRSSEIFYKFKKFFPNKFSYIIESEGDLVSEFDYLAKNPYKKDFYAKLFSHMEKKIKIYEQELLNANYIICVSENLRKLFISRYSLDEKKIISLTTGCDSNIFNYNKELREKTRKKLNLKSKFVMIYVGSVYFSWQNISRTLELYKMIKNFKSNTKMIIITNSIEKQIILDFLKKKDIPRTEIILKFSIPNDLIPRYLNASDLGVILRDNHLMNNVAAPGKFGEYACSGLPILTGDGISDFSEKLKKTSFGIVLENIYDDKEFLIKFNKFIQNSNSINRYKLSNWGVENFSFKAFIDKYCSFINAILKNEN